VDHSAAADRPPAPGELARYRSEIGFTDGHVGAVLDALAAGGLADDTAVLFLSDHGESFLEHPPIQRHSYSLFEEELRVPLFLRVPGLAPRRVATPVRLVDLRPTLLALLDVGEGPGATCEGVDLAPLLVGDTDAARPPNLAEIRLKDGYHRNALVDGDWKLIEDVSNRRLELYDLARDPRERENLAAREPERAAELAAELRLAIERAELLGRDFAADAAVEHTPEAIEHLRKMGYAGDDEPGESKQER
jgi:arylsulfatase A-like enzyme